VLFSTGQRANETIPSLIVELSDQKLVGLCRDDKVVDFFCAKSGSMARDNSCRFSDSLLDLGLLNLNPFYAKRNSLKKLSL